MTMGSFDGAETCELVGMFMLDKLKQTNLDLGLYRDDGLGVTSLKGRPLDSRQRDSKSSRSSDNTTSASPSPPTSRPLTFSTSS